MSSLWTPDGERPVARTPRSSEGAGAPDPGTTTAPDPAQDADSLRVAAAAIGLDLDTMTEEDRAQLQAELNEMMQVRRQIAATPAGEVLTGHVSRLFDLVTIYLGADPPAFADAATVIEAVRGLLEGVGDRFGEHEQMLREALGQAQMVFVQVKEATEDS